MTIEEIGKEIEAHSLSLEIIVHRCDEESEFASALFEVARRLSDSGGKGITCSEGTGRDVPGLPAVTFRQPARGTITYMALPSGRERDPFREMLLWRLGANDGIIPDLRLALGKLDRSVSIMVFIAAACPHCPNAVRAATRVSLSCPHVATTIIDVEQFPAQAAKFNIRTVPMTIIDDELLFNEVVTSDILTSAIVSENRADYLEMALRSNVETNTIDLGSRSLLDNPEAADAFLAIWKQSVLSARMGLMLMAAQALEEKPAIFDAIVPGLIAQLNVEDDSLRGDTADLLGQIGHPDVKKPLEELLDDDNPDIVEIAEDALEHLREREEQQ